jgi:isoleucyl-tRNA synthetase
VHWCLDCRSALAEAEVEYEDKTSPAIDVALPTSWTVPRPRAALGADQRWAAARVWSSGPPRPGRCRPTRPWRSASEFEYVLVEAGARRAGASRACEGPAAADLQRWASAMADARIVAARFEGQVLEGLKLSTRS